MRIRVDFDFPEETVQQLINEAYGAGWLREEPRKAWTSNEKKEACRYAIMRRMPA